MLTTYYLLLTTYYLGTVFPEPTVVDSYGDDFVSRFVWDGTRDRSPFCAISDALAFRAALGGEGTIMSYNHHLYHSHVPSYYLLLNTLYLAKARS